MLDFTSALYLGLRHRSRSLAAWDQLTTGAPAALVEPPAARRVASALAALQGCESAMLAPSTLHLFWDLFGVLAQEPSAIYVDAGSYPIARWGVERAAARGARVFEFPHHDAAALRTLLRRTAGAGRQVVIVSDGYCPGCGRHAPLADYLTLAQLFDGQLIMDDTQAIGIYGHAPHARAPYGTSGGGSLCWHGLSDPRVLLVASLAKAFGAPIAALSGSRALVRRFERESETRVHCSPPSLAALHAAERALMLNAECGDALRLRLIRLVRRFRRQLVAAGFVITGGLFPVQTLGQQPGLNTVELHERLLQQGVRTVLHRERAGQAARLSFIITALHTSRAIDRAAIALAAAAGRMIGPLVADGERRLPHALPAVEL